MAPGFYGFYAPNRHVLAESDVISFHNYGWPEDLEKEVAGLVKHNRLVTCTEYLARSVGSTLDVIRPIAKKHHVAAINWGFVNGKSQTNRRWDSWDRPYVKTAPSVWFHDVLHPNGTRYRERDAKSIRELTGKTTLKK